MKATLHYLPGATIQVEPTMQALGDQPYRCRVYPDQAAKAAGLHPEPRKPETYNYFQGVMVEAGSREEAARAAAREFNALYPDAAPIEIQSSPGAGLYSPTCEYCG